jgi:hypothetical protein
MVFLIAALLVFGTACGFAILASPVSAAESRNTSHKNTSPPPSLTPVLRNSGSAVLERMASFLDDYENKFENHLGCELGELKKTYGYSKCVETFSNGTYTTSKLLKTPTKQPDKYYAVFYQYSGEDAASERNRLVAFINQHLPIGSTDGTWDIKFANKMNFDGYHYQWSGANAFKIWIKLVNDELRVSATAYLSNQ